MVIIFIVFVICLIIYLYSLYHNKLLFLNEKITNVEEKINSTLIKRKELIKESEKLIKMIINTDKNIYEGLDESTKEDSSMMKLDRKLLIYINEFYLIKDKYKKLQKDENFLKISYAIDETTDTLNAYKEYYNDVAQKYNKLIKSFPVIIVTFIKGRKEKEFFDKKSINDNDYNNFKY